MAGCAEIDLGSDPNCDDLPVGGTRARIFVFNIDDISGYSTLADGTITGVNLLPGKFAYRFTGFRNDVKKSEEVVKPDTGIPKFKHNAGWVIYERTQEQKNNVEKLARGRFVIVVENNGKDVTSFEVVGKDVGVEIVAGPIRNAHENGGYFVLSFSTPDDLGELENKLPVTFLLDNYEDTVTLLTSYLQAS